MILTITCSCGTTITMTDPVAECGQCGAKYALVLYGVEEQTTGASADASSMLHTDDPRQHGRKRDRRRRQPQ